MEPTMEQTTDRAAATRSGAPAREEDLRAMEHAVRGYLVRINGRAWGVTLGVLFGLVLFVATNLLVLKGGPDMGKHLSLLRHYLPGFEVTFVGSLVGFAYAFAIGFLTGRLICGVYNAVANTRWGRS
jgi:hypothetical protein